MSSRFQPGHHQPAGGAHRALPRQASTTSGFSRLKGYASHLSNYIHDTKELLQSNTSKEGQRDIELREKYTEKIFKWLGKNIAHTTNGCTSYKVRLITIIPADIWQQTKKEPPQVYVIKEIEFSVN